jgi:hypothetical protein
MMQEITLKGRNKKKEQIRDGPLEGEGQKCVYDKMTICMQPDAYTSSRQVTGNILVYVS